MPEIKTRQNQGKPVLNTAQQQMQRSFVKARQEQAVQKQNEQSESPNSYAEEKSPGRQRMPFGMWPPFLTACNMQESDNGVGINPEAFVILDSEVWPQNEYTEELPVPAGQINNAYIDFQNNFCFILVGDISKTVKQNLMNTSPR